MLFAKFGVKSTPIDVAEFMINCPACETDNWADVMIVSNYYHFYFVPIFPIGKEANIICKKCGLKRNGAGFNAKLISNYDEVKNLFRHPWYTYIGVSVAVLLVLLILLFSIL